MPAGQAAWQGESAELVVPSAPLPFEHRRPSWLRVPVPWAGRAPGVESTVRAQRLHTVCEAAKCPNRGLCWGRGTATFLILGATCTRDCRFCAVPTGRPQPVDPLEPERVAEAVRRLQLRHAVLTSVTRDDLADGGASVFAACIAQIRAVAPSCSIEVLIPDFGGDERALSLVLSANPDVLNHNLETVGRLYATVRPQADYERSIALLRQAKLLLPGVLTKSGIMVGLGETRAELTALMADLAAAQVDILTIGQYLRPSRDHLPICRYYAPAEFEELAAAGQAAGLRWVEAGPLVRSSYRAEQQVASLRGAQSS